MDRFVCKEHLIEDTSIQSNLKTETLLSWQVLKSLHNQQAVAQGPWKRAFSSQVADGSIES